MFDNTIHNLGQGHAACVLATHHAGILLGCKLGPAGLMAAGARWLSPQQSQERPQAAPAMTRLAPCLMLKQHRLPALASSTSEQA